LAKSRVIPHPRSTYFLLRLSLPVHVSGDVEVWTAPQI